MNLEKVLAGADVLEKIDCDRQGFVSEMVRIARRWGNAFDSYTFEAEALQLFNHIVDFRERKARQDIIDGATQ